MKKLFDRLKEAWYGMLPWILLIGVPSMFGIVLAIVFNWENIIQLLNRFDEIFGSKILGIILSLGSTIASLNIAIGFFLTLEKITKKFSSKWVYTYIIITALAFLSLYIFLPAIIMA